MLSLPVKLHLKLYIMEDESKEPLEEQIERFIRKKSDENLALKNLIEGLEKAEKEKTVKDRNNRGNKFNKES